MRIRILDRYILSNHIGPYCFSLAIITFIFVMDFIIRWLDKFIGKGVSVLTILEFFFLSLGHMFALIIPMAVMPATLMAFGQLAADNEVTAMKSSGVSLYRMIAPVLAATAALTLGLVFYFNMLLPESNHRLMNLMLDIGRMKPTLQIKENMFSDALAGYTILVREKNDKTGEIKGVQIFELKGGVPKSIIAASGRMIYRESESVLRFELDDGEIHEMPDPADIKTYRRTLFKHFTLNIQDTERTLKRSDRTHRNDREMTVAMMRAKILEYEGTSDATRAHMNQVALDFVVATFARVIEDARTLAPGASPPPPRPEPGATKAVPKIESEAEQILQVLETQTYALDSNLRQINRYGVEIHKKFALPFSCIIFVLLGAPLAIRSGKRGMTISIGFSILLFLIYYIFLISGEKLADRRLMEPWLAMWLANIVFLVVAVFILRQTNREFGVIDWARLNPAKWWRRADS
ncbi:MAG: LptF/LptG family permease [Candidatus Krumholzibacteria bacterium]|nr:LptF/LptG family permease [Candidatus Krumholzibacteria bacterium]